MIETELIKHTIDFDSKLSNLSQSSNQRRIIGGYGGSGISNNIQNRLRKVEDSQNTSSKTISTLTGIMIGFVVVVGIAVIGWLVDTFWRLNAIKSDFIQEKQEISTLYNKCSSDIELLKKELEHMPETLDNHINKTLIDYKLLK